MEKVLGPWTTSIYALLRIVTGFLFFQHGLPKLLGGFGRAAPAEPFTQMWFAGVIEVFGGAALAYELAYGKGLTPFLRLAQNAGVPRLADGVGMLVEQAAEAFAWWRGVRPETAALIARLTVPIK